MWQGITKVFSLPIHSCIFSNFLSLSHFSYSKDCLWNCFMFPKSNCLYELWTEIIHLLIKWPILNYIFFNPLIILSFFSRHFCFLCIVLSKTDINMRWEKKYFTCLLNAKVITSQTLFLNSYDFLIFKLLDYTST